MWPGGWDALTGPAWPSRTEGGGDSVQKLTDWDWGGAAPGWRLGHNCPEYTLSDNNCPPITMSVSCPSEWCRSHAQVGNLEVPSRSFPTPHPALCSHHAFLDLSPQASLRSLKFSLYFHCYHTSSKLPTPLFWMLYWHFNWLPCIYL